MSDNGGMTPRRRASAPSFTAHEFRDALAMFATGVTIVTARDTSGGLIGLTANSFNSVSLEPPLVLWSLAREAGSMPTFARGSHYAINILAAGQAERLNDCGAGVRPPSGVAVGDEAGTTPDAA